jgi:purine nucleoside permease
LVVKIDINFLKQSANDGPAFWSGRLLQSTTKNWTKVLTMVSYSPQNSCSMAKKFH